MKASEYLESHWNPNTIWTHLEWPKHQIRLKRCTDFLKGKTFCDVGCGLGHSTEIMSRFKKGKWHGIEEENLFVKNLKVFGGVYSGGIMGIANHVFKDIEFYAANDPEPGRRQQDLKFDSVVCSEVIEHVKKDKQFIANLLRMTKKVLVMTTPCKKVNDPGHVRLYTEESLKAVLDYLKVKNYQILKEFPFFYIVVNK